MPTPTRLRFLRGFASSGAGRTGSRCGLILIASLGLGMTSAHAQIEYIGNIALPAVHEDIVRQATAPLDPGNPDSIFAAQSLRIVTPHSIYYAQFSSDGNQSNWFPLDIPFQSDVSLNASTIALQYNRGHDTPPRTANDDSLLLTGSRNAIYEYDFVSRLRLNTMTVITPPSPRDAIALGQGLFLNATGNNQIWSTPTTSGLPLSGASATFTNIFGGTGTGNTQFVNLTEMAFGPGRNGLLFALDWGAQQVKAFDVSDPGQNYFRYSFDLPAGLDLTNLTGRGFAVDDFGHVLVADGQGGGVELSLTGELLATFSPPSNDLLGLNANAGDADYITFDAAGNIFVENGANGLHWYRDLAAIPEPSTYAAILGVMALCLVGARSLKERRAGDAASGGPGEDQGRSAPTYR